MPVVVALVPFLLIPPPYIEHQNPPHLDIKARNIRSLIRNISEYSIFRAGEAYYQEVGGLPKGKTLVLGRELGDGLQRPS